MDGGGRLEPDAGAAPDAASAGAVPEYRHDGPLGPADPFQHGSVDADPSEPDADEPDAAVPDASGPDADAGGLQDGGRPTPADAGPPRLAPLAPIDELVAAKQAARSRLIGLTIGGQPARTTH
jgi:hypothetical protein